jgi:aerobic-type carbon monoxide dehydrogenase small subunit (CoxS/CutS family)
MRLTVNGEQVDVDAASDATLLSILREKLRLTGAKEACGRGECGACTVLVDSVAVASCLTLAVRVRGNVETIEGLAAESTLLREAFADSGAFQCGFCTPGQIVRALELLRGGALRKVEDPETFVRRQMSGNICRCTGYTAIVDAILRVALPERLGPNPEKQGR